MADNVNDSLKNLNQNIKDADANLAKLSKDFNVVFTEAVNRASSDAKVSIDQMFDAIAGRVGASKASKLKLLFDIVDEHGKTATPQTIQRKIDQIVNAKPNAKGTKLHIEMDWVDVDTANANLRRYKEQLKLIQDMPAAYDLVNRAVNAIISEFDKEAAAKQKIIEENEKILEQEIAIEEKQRSEAAAQQQKQEEKQYKEEQKWYDAKAKADRENERRAGEAKYRQMSKEVVEYGKALQRQIELETKANQIRRDYNRIKSDLQGISKQSEEYKKGQQVLQQYRQELHDVYQEQKKIDNEYKGTRAAAYNQQRINGLRQEYELLRRNWRQIKENNSLLESMLPTLRRLAGAFGVAFSVQGLVQFGKKLVETRGEFELQQVAMRSILQNKQLADEIWDKTMQAALQSPFTAMQLTRYTKQLAAYRIETEKLFDTTKMLADVSAGLGVDMQRLILAYGQVKAANYLRASEIRQFTEAGVNILGELSTYLSEVNGKVITTAQVMDMVQKRMVTFEDVEAIFKRMTEEGGTFYNMQYVQSQTVKGQINKLHDAYDQMLNSIGKANEGTLKNMVALLNNIVKNWREWKTVLDSIAWPLIISSIYKFGRGLTTTAAQAVVATRSINGLTRAGARMQLLFKSINPWVALATAIGTATFAIINHTKSVKAVQKEIDEQNLRLYETKEQMEGYQKTLEENNKAIKEGSLSEDKLKEKRKENSEIIAKLKNDYPEVAKGLELERDGTVKLTDALKNYNDELERRMTLQNMLGTGGGWFSDTLKENMQEWETDLSQLKGEIISMQSAANGAIMKLELNKKTDLPIYEILKQIRNIDTKDIVKAREEYERLYSLLYSKTLDVGLEGFNASAVRGVDIFGFNIDKLTKFPHDIKQVTRETNEEFDNFLTSLENDFDNTVSSFGEYSQKIDEEYGGNVLSFIANNTHLINEGVKDGSADMVKTIRTVLQTAGIGLTQESKNYYNGLLNARLRYLKMQEKLNQVEADGIKGRMALVKDAMLNKEEWEDIDFFAAPLDLTTTKPFGDGTGEGKTEAQKMISLIKEMNSEYTKLSKSAYGFAMSQDKVTDSFRDAFAEIFKVRGGEGTYIDYQKVDFTSKQGVANALQALYDELKATNSFAKFGKGFEQELLKAIGTAKVEVDIELTTRKRENVAKQLEDAFGDYQLTLDLEKLQLPSGLLKDMFDIDGTDLAGMRRELERLSKDLTDENGVMTGDNLKLYEQWLKKLDDEERKLQQQRLKDYSKYLEYQLSERAKLEMEYVRKVAEVQSEVAYDDTTRQRILDGLRKEYEKNIAKQDWEDFKGSEMYIEMMEDLTKQGTAALEEMRKKLLEVRDNAENLSPRALKEVINALEKIDETIYGRMTPFQAVKELRKQAKGAMNENGVLDISEAFNRDYEAKKSYEEHRKEREEIEETIADRQKEKEILDQLGDSYADNIRIIQQMQKSTRDERIELENELVTLGEENENNQARRQDILHQINDLKAEEADYQNRIDLATKLQSIQDKLAKSKYKGIGLEQLSQMSKEELEAMGISEDEMKDMGEVLKYWKLMRQAELKALDELKEYFSVIQGIAKNTSEMLHTLGVQQNPLSDYWEQATDAAFSYAQETIDAIKQFKEAKIQAEAIAGVGEDLITGNYIKLALRLLGVLIQVINQVGLFRNARINKEIEDQQEYIDELSLAYGRLEKQIERTWETTTYMRNYEQQVQNIREQIDATEAQMRAAQSRKNVDQSEINEYQSSLYDLYDQLDELEQKQIEVFGGIGEEGYRSAAEGFVDAWKQAFLETGDGLQGLQDHFDEFLQDWFVKQATMRIAGNMLQPMFDMIDKAVDPNYDGGVAVTMQELEALRDWADVNFPLISDTLEDLAGIFGVGGEGSLSGLAAGIQGITEEQANVLEAYWNSVRMYTASIDQNVARIAQMLGVGGPSSNPMLAQLQTIADNTAYIQDIYNLLIGTRRNLGNGQGFITYNQ